MRTSKKKWFTRWRPPVRYPESMKAGNSYEA
jgi:hypothetical protein